MAHEIDSDFTFNWSNEATQCSNCISFEDRADKGYCSEAQSEIPFDAHCDFFKSKD